MKLENVSSKKSQNENKRPQNDNSKLADLRHDLKNKLATIHGYTELLLTKLTEDKQKKWANEILIEAKKMREFIDEKVR